MSAPKGGRQCSKDNHFDLMIKIGNSCDHYPFRLDQTHKASTTVGGDYLFGLDNTVIQTNTSQRETWELEISVKTPIHCYTHMLTVHSRKSLSLMHIQKAS